MPRPGDVVLATVQFTEPPRVRGSHAASALGGAHPAERLPPKAKSLPEAAGFSPRRFTDTPELKKRPALVLFEELGNLVVAGITSNTSMKGIPLSRNEGAVSDSVIKLNYIFTISSEMVHKPLFSLSVKKKKLVFDELVKRLGGLVR